ncbi:hypothetical protein BGZ63DRAFT_124196 [Mariannaea sp. PMI_226]|nr:hypothetical protein BGZ63DRAFT_124196 [Mariannaea sp. PMI_226]
MHACPALRLGESQWGVGLGVIACNTTQWHILVSNGFRAQSPSRHPQPTFTSEPGKSTRAPIAFLAQYACMHVLYLQTLGYQYVLCVRVCVYVRCVLHDLSFFSDTTTPLSHPPHRKQRISEWLSSHTLSTCMSQTIILAELPSLTEPLNVNFQANLNKWIQK